MVPLVKKARPINAPIDHVKELLDRYVLVDLRVYRNSRFSGIVATSKLCERDSSYVFIIIIQRLHTVNVYMSAFSRNSIDRLIDINRDPA